MIPCGHREEVSGLKTGTCLFGSAQVKRAAHWSGPISQSQHRKCQQTSTSGHLICSGWQGVPAFLSSAVGSAGWREQ